jgi:hypothetical protein
MLFDQVLLLMLLYLRGEGASEGAQCCPVLSCCGVCREYREASQAKTESVEITMESDSCRGNPELLGFHRGSQRPELKTTGTGRVLKLHRRLLPGSA